MKRFFQELFSVGLVGILCASLIIPPAWASVDFDPSPAAAAASAAEHNVGDAGGATDTGVGVLVIRDDVLTTLVNPDGDYVRLRVDSVGRLHVTGAAGTQFSVDDALGATPEGTLTIVRRDDVLSTLTPAEGDAVELRVGSQGALWTRANSPTTQVSTTHQSTTLTAGDDSADGTLALVGGYTIASVHISVGAGLTGVVAVAPEVSYDGGTTFVQVYFLDVTNDRVTLIAPVALFSSQEDDFLVDVRGATHLRARIQDTSGNVATVTVSSEAVVGGNLGSELALHATASSFNTTTNQSLGIGVVRNDTPVADRAGGDNAWTVLQTDAFGGLYVRLLGTAGAAFDASTLATESSLSTLAGTVAGSEQQVDIVAPLPAGTNNIGDVDVLSIIPGTGATNLGKAVDSAGGGTDTGVGLLALRDDVLTTLTPADGDYVRLRVSSTGELHVTDAGAGGGTEFAEDTPHTTGDLGTEMLAVRNDVLASLSDTDGDYSVLQVDDLGALYVQGPVQEDSPSASGNYGFPTFGLVNEARATFATTGLDYTNFGVTALGDVFTLPLFSTTVASPLQIGKREDFPHASFDVGVMALAVRNDVLAPLATLDGDYSPFQTNASGALYTTGGIGITESGYFELIGINETVAAEQYSGSISIPNIFGTGRVTKVCLLSTESGTGAIRRAEGDLLMFDTDPTISPGDSTILTTERDDIDGILRFREADWQDDANGATNCQEVDETFHIAPQFIVWFSAAGQATWNTLVGDDEQLRMYMHFRRAS